MKYELENTSVRKTIFHEVGHFIAYYVLNKGLKGFYSLFIAQSNGFQFLTDKPEFEIKKGKMVWNDEPKLLGRISHGDSRLTNFEKGIVCFAGYATEIIIKKRRKNVILKGSDKTNFEKRNLPKSYKTKCRKEAVRILTENKELLYFITKRIYKQYMERPEVQKEERRFSKEIYCPPFTIKRKGIEEILKEYKEEHQNNPT